MELPACAGGGLRAAAGREGAPAAARAWGGRAGVRVVPFAATLGAGEGSGADSARGATALGDALAELPQSPDGQELDGVVVVSDGAVNAGQDPVAAARALGVPVH